MELVIFVGLQASGKSTYYAEHFAATHVHVSKDLMRNARSKEGRQLGMIEEALAEGRSVVVDNTNPTPAVRAPLIAAGRAFGARVVGYWFDIPVRTAVARNRAREAHARVPDVAIFATSRKLVAASFDEGFDEIHVVAQA